MSFVSDPNSGFKWTHFPPRLKEPGLRPSRLTGLQRYFDAGVLRADFVMPPATEPILVGTRQMGTRDLRWTPEYRAAEAELERAHRLYMRLKHPDPAIAAAAREEREMAFKKADPAPRSTRRK